MLYLAGGLIEETVTAYSLTRDKVKAYIEQCSDWVSVGEILEQLRIEM